MKVLNIFILIFIFSSSANAQIPENEKQALKDLYRFTNGIEWKNTWDFSKNIEDFYGVRIEDSHVVGLALTNNRLEGELPSTLRYLEYLKFFDVSSNNLNGELPEIKFLKRLEVLNLADNKLSGNLPNALKGFKNLKHLKLATNYFDNAKDFKTLEDKSLKLLLTSNTE